MDALTFHTGGPPARGHYTNVVEAGGLLFTTGMTPVDPATGAVVDGDVAAQARMCIRNLASALEAAGSDLAHVAKTVVFLVDWADFAAVDAVYAETWPRGAPARSIACGPRPHGHRLGIEAIAVRPRGIPTGGERLHRA